MGIFNPSSSVTFTSSGFSPFTVSSSLCNNIGYKIAVLAGPIPNNANSLTINKVYLTSATGANTTTASYTLTNPVTLKSGQSTTIIIPNVACNSANIHYSLSAKIQYSYDVPTIGLQTVNTTGTVAGTSITGKPSTLTTYEPITITNTQSSATPSPFQQMINFTSSDSGFSSIATGNFGQNVEFFYSNGTVIPSWLESYTGSNAIWWLKLGSIPASSSITVYMGIAPTSTNLFNTVNDGEAPQIPCGSTSPSSCSNYAEYDDGANVFNNYWNFAGTTLNSGISTISGVTLTQDNELNFSVTSTTNTFYIMTSTSESSPFIIESLYTDRGSSANPQFGLVIDSNTPTSQDTGGGPGGTNYIYRLGSSSGYQIVEGGSVLVLGSIPYSYPYTTIGTFIQNSTSLKSIVDGFTITTSTTALSSGYIGFYIYSQAATTNEVTLQWLRTRSYPPNGIMPSVSFSNVA